MTWFNFEIDELYIGDGNLARPSVDDGEAAFFPSLHISDRSRIQRLTVDVSADNFFYDMLHADAQPTVAGRGLGFNAIRSLTITCLTPSLDIVLNEVHDNTGEMQAWTINKEGEAILGKFQ